MNLSVARKLVQRFASLKALVVGDLMLDHYVWGKVSRISPEAPVPVVEVAQESEMPGGAGNVGANLASLGADVYISGLLGNDYLGDRLLKKFEECRVRTSHAVRHPERRTTVKTRIIAHQQQIVRVDRENRETFEPALHQRIWSQVEEALPYVDTIILSDYAKGVVSTSLTKKLIPAARRKGIPVIVDPKPENILYYKNVSTVTPNLKEAMESMGVRSVRTEAELENLGEKLRARINADAVLITRGEKGMSLFERKKPVYHIPTRAREVFDVTGAGDTVISVFALAVAAGANFRTAAELANHAAGLVVAKLGTASVTGSELLKAVGGRG